MSVVDKQDNYSGAVVRWFQLSNKYQTTHIPREGNGSLGHFSKGAPGQSTFD